MNGQMVSQKRRKEGDSREDLNLKRGDAET